MAFGALLRRNEEFLPDDNHVGVNDAIGVGDALHGHAVAQGNFKERLVLLYDVGRADATGRCPCRACGLCAKPARGRSANGDAGRWWQDTSRTTAGDGDALPDDDELNIGDATGTGEVIDRNAVTQGQAEEIFAGADFVDTDATYGSGRCCGEGIGLDEFFGCFRRDGCGCSADAEGFGGLGDAKLGGLGDFKDEDGRGQNEGVGGWGLLFLGDSGHVGGGCGYIGDDDVEGEVFFGNFFGVFSDFGFFCHFDEGCGCFGRCG